MTPLYVDGAAGCQKGADAAETGIKLESVTTTATDPQIFTRDHQGTRDGFCHAYDSEVTIDIEGEISGTTGLMLAKFGTAQTIANDESGAYATTDFDGNSVDTHWGIVVGGFYLTGSPTITGTREDLKSVSLSFMANPDII